MGEYARANRRQALAGGAMGKDRLIRLAAVLVGIGVIFGLEQQLDTKAYIAIPAGILAYTVTRLILGLAFGSGSQLK